MSVIVQSPWDEDRILRRSAPCIRSSPLPAWGQSGCKRRESRRITVSPPPSFAEASPRGQSPRGHQRSLQPRIVEPSVVVKCDSSTPTCSAPMPRQTPRSPPPSVRNALRIQQKTVDPETRRGDDKTERSGTISLQRPMLVPQHDLAEERSPRLVMRPSEKNNVGAAWMSSFEKIAMPMSSTLSEKSASGKQSTPHCRGKPLVEGTMQRRQTIDGSSMSLLSPGRRLSITPKSMSPSRLGHASAKLAPSVVQHRPPISDDGGGGSVSTPISAYYRRNSASDDGCRSVSTSASTYYREVSSQRSSGADDASQKESQEMVPSARLADFSWLRKSSPELVVDVEVEDDWIDPSRSSLKPLIFEVLGVSPNAFMRRMEKTHGGLNQGLWTVRDSSQEFVLKMVTCTRFMGLPTEAEAFTSLVRRAPQLADDPSISFPVKIFHCRCSDGQMKDLIAMRKLAGTCFADLILSRLAAGRTWELGRELESFGKFLAGFHARHSMQHGDLQPANVIYNELSRQFSLIDVAEMGNPRIKETDAEHFVSGLRTMTKRHGSRAFEDCKKKFEAGFNDATS